MSTEKLYVVIKRGLFWRPEDRGYTSEINEAGRYTKEEAQDRCHGGEQPVTMALASEFQTTESIKAENSQLRTDLATALRNGNEHLANAQQFAAKCETLTTDLDAARAEANALRLAVELSDNQASALKWAKEELEAAQAKASRFDMLEMELHGTRLALAAAKDEAEKAKARAALIDDENYNLTVLIGRLCHSYRKVDPDNKIVASATDYLRRINKMGSPLRADAARKEQP